MSIGKNIAALKFITMLGVPFDETNAFKLGIIDKTGHVIRKPVTQEDHDSFSILEKLVFTLKRLIEKIPGAKQRIGSIAAAYWLMKESDESTDLNELEIRFNKLIEMDVCFIEEECEIENLLESEIEHAIKKLHSLPVVPENEKRFGNKGRDEIHLKHIGFDHTSSGIYGFNHSDLKKFVHMKIPTKGLGLGQHTVHKDHVENILRGKVQGGSEHDRVTAVLHNGKYILQQGHHRVSAEILKGRTHIHADVIEAHDSHNSRTFSKELKYKKPKHVVHEEIAANNTAGVEVKNPDAVPKKKKTVKDFIRRKSSVDMSIQLEK